MIHVPDPEDMGLLQLQLRMHDFSAQTLTARAFVSGGLGSIPGVLDKMAAITLAQPVFLLSLQSQWAGGFLSAPSLNTYSNMFVFFNERKIDIDPSESSKSMWIHSAVKHLSDKMLRVCLQKRL